MLCTEVDRLLRPLARLRGRDREGACNRLVSVPPPQPSPASRGGSTPSVRRIHWLTQSQVLRRFEPDRAMGRDNDQPSSGEMGAHELGQHNLGRCIERGIRLIEQPNSGVRRRPGVRARAGAFARPKDRGLGGPPARRARPRRAPRWPCRRRKIHPEGEVLEYRKRGLEGILVAEIVDLLAERELGVSAFELDLPSCRGYQPGYEAKEGGLASAIRAAHRQRFAGGEGEAQSAEDLSSPLMHASSRAVNRIAGHHAPLTLSARDIGDSMISKP